MKINNINQQQRQNFNGKIARTFADNPKLTAGIAALAGSSVIAQKIVMSGSEAIIGPAMDIGIGKAITKVTDEKDNRTNESSRVQAIRTFSQSVGGTITGVAIRWACIGLSTLLCRKFGEKAGSKIGEALTQNINVANKYEFSQNAAKWGKNIGGALATVVMFGTNFIIDAPFINWINKKSTEVCDNIRDKKANKIKQPKPQINTKEVK